MIKKIKELLAKISGCWAKQEQLKKQLSEAEVANGVLAERNKELEAEAKVEEVVVLNLTTAIKELEEQLAPPVAPTAKGEISYTAIYSLYAKLFPNDKDNIKISDRKFEICTIAELRRFVKWSKIDKLLYVKEFLDCDDFAIALAGEFAKYSGWSGFPVTFIWGDLYGGHAFCTAVAWPSIEDKTPTAYFFEPQTDVEIAIELVEDMKLTVLPMSKR